MTTLTQKLRHNRGASMTLALLFFLMCLLVAGTVMAAASAAATRAAARDDEQQAYLAVSSAAEFVRKDLLNAVELVATASDVGGSVVWSTDPPGCVFGGFLAEGVAAVRDSDPYAPFEKTLEFTLDGIDVDKVTLDFTMDDTYTITCIFTTDESLYTMSLSTQALIEDDTTDSFKITLSPAQIKKGEAATT